LRRPSRAWTRRRPGNIVAKAVCQANCHRRCGGGRGQIRSSMFGTTCRNCLKTTRRARGQDGVRVFTATESRPLSGRAGACAAAAGEGVPCHPRSGPGGVLRAPASCGSAGSVGLHKHGRAGRDHPGQSFPHRVYHFVQTYSKREAAAVCLSESFRILSEGLRNALWMLGKVPHRYRTDRLSTAVNNMSDPVEFTDRYRGLMRSYGLESEKTQAGHGKENGDAEQRHHRFKRAAVKELNPERPRSTLPQTAQEPQFLSSDSSPWPAKSVPRSLQKPALAQQSVFSPPRPSYSRP